MKDHRTKKADLAARGEQGEGVQGSQASDGGETGRKDEKEFGVQSKKL